MNKHRVFFALWPEPEVAEHLAALGRNLAADCGGRLIPVAQLHMTLAFIGNVTASRLDDLLELAATVRAEAFELRLDRLGFWPQGGILWAGCRQSPSRTLSAGDSALPAREALSPACRALRASKRRVFMLFENLRIKLEAAGFLLAGRPFTPHVTLARGARCASLPRLGTPLSWRVNEFALVESVSRPLGVDYVTRARFAPEDS